MLHYPTACKLRGNLLKYNLPSMVNRRTHISTKFVVSLLQCVNREFETSAKANKGTHKEISNNCILKV
jgi:hypothetical protein